MKYCDACKTTYPNDFAVCPRDQSTLRVTSELMQGAIIRNKYEVLEKIGVGGMATVYKARHLTFNELRALKLVSAKLLDDELFIKRFKTEAIVTRKLKHVNAVRVEDFDETEDGRPFIVMEYVEGANLREEIRREKKLPTERALAIARQAAAALAAAHQLGITHRDIKPDNILLVRLPDGTDQVKVLDFGIAKMKEGSLDRTSYTPTQTGIVMGTPQYISPEQALGRTGDEVDGRADIYSLGVVLYEMLCGELPFQSDTPIGLLMHHIHTVPTPPHTLNPDLPPAISQLLLKCLQKDRLLRFQSADELLATLNHPGMAATTEMLGSNTLGQGMAAAAKTATKTVPLATPPQPAAATVTPPGLPTAPLAPPAAPRVATLRVKARPMQAPQPKSHKGLYAIVTVAALVVVGLVGFAVLRPQPQPPAAAPQTQGTPAPVVTPPSAADAAKVTAQIQTLLNSSPALEHHPIRVTFADGMATLAGTVGNKSEIELAQALTANVPGVRSVNNQLVVTSPAEAPNAHRDAAAKQLAQTSPANPAAAQPVSSAASEATGAAKPTEDSATNGAGAYPIADNVNASREQRVKKLVENGYLDMNNQPPRARKAYYEFSKALELDPGNQQALAGIERVEQMRQQAQQRSRFGQKPR